MITGHCTAGLHTKCLHPGRCSCDCHPTQIETLTPHEGHTPIEATLDCPACPCSFRDQAGLDHHTRTIHRDPEKEAAMAGGNTAKPLDETCPHNGCGQHFANTAQRGAHYRFNPDHKPADLVTTYDRRKGAAPRGTTKPAGKAPANRAARRTPPSVPVAAAPPEVITTDTGAVIDRQWTIGPLDISLTVHLSDDTADALRKVIELGDALDGLAS